jgi:hypothetical protein
VIPSRRSQPYRRGYEFGREPGPTLQAMLSGRSLYGQNPADVQRLLQRRRRMRYRRF